MDKDFARIADAVAAGRIVLSIQPDGLERGLVML